MLAAYFGILVLARNPQALAFVEPFARRIRG
jgi:hypothetical protein